MLIDNDTLAARLKAQYDARQKDVDKLIELSHATTKTLARMDAMEEGNWDDVKKLQAEGWVSVSSDRKGQGVYIITLSRGGKTMKIKVYG